MCNGQLRTRPRPWNDRLQLLLFGVFHLLGLPVPREVASMRKLCLLALLASPWSWLKAASASTPTAFSSFRPGRFPEPRPRGGERLRHPGDPGQRHRAAHRRVADGAGRAHRHRPSDQPFSLVVRQGEIGTGGHITASGAAGSMKKPASAGRDLSLRLEQVRVDEITLDVRGGIGTPGYSGLAGADGDSGGCLWGSASRGHDGQNGGDGRPGRGRPHPPGSAGGFPCRTGEGTPGRRRRWPGGRGGGRGSGRSRQGLPVLPHRCRRQGPSGATGPAGQRGAAGRLDVVRIQ